jgi:alkylated DNA nucleotide flippase Atl1
MTPRAPRRATPDARRATPDARRAPRDARRPSRDPVPRDPASRHPAPYDAASRAAPRDPACRDADGQDTVPRDDDSRDGAPPLDDFASRVLDVVDSIPPGRVMSYGDIAVYLAAGPGPRQVGRVMSVYGGAVAWWRVIHSDGTPAPGHEVAALRHYQAEGTPLRSARTPLRVDMRRARWPGHPAD